MSGDGLVLNLVGRFYGHLAEFFFTADVPEVISPETSLSAETNMAAEKNRKPRWAQISFQSTRVVVAVAIGDRPF